jgi:hypothetical protein
MKNGMHGIFDGTGHLRKYCIRTEQELGEACGKIMSLEGTM